MGQPVKPSPQAIAAALVAYDNAMHGKRLSTAARFEAMQAALEAAENERAKLCHVTRASTATK